MYVIGSAEVKELVHLDIATDQISPGLIDHPKISWMLSSSSRHYFVHSVSSFQSFHMIKTAMCNANLVLDGGQVCLLLATGPG